MNMEKLRGSLTKWPGRRGTGGFQPLDRDLRVQDEGVRRSNLGRPFGIGRSGGVWARGVAALLAGALLRGGGSPETADLGHPGSILGRVWPGR